MELKVAIGAILIAAMTLGGCDREAISERARNPNGQEAEKAELQAHYERVRLALVRNGQGCSGQILRGHELRAAVPGRQIEPRSPAPVVVHDGPNLVRTYLSNGEFKTSGQFGMIYVGRYWVADDAICYENDYGKGCSRLIRDTKGDLNEEVLDDRHPKSFRLACTPIQLEVATAGAA